MSRVLGSVDVLLRGGLCGEEDRCVDFLFSYAVGAGLFEGFERRLIDCGRDIAAILSMEERAFLDAVVTTGGLSDVGKLVSGGVNVLGRMPGLAWNCRPEDF